MNPVEKLLCTGNKYLKSMDLADMAALKFCLISMGTLLGLGIPAKLKKPTALLGGLLFLGTYIPLMSKFVDLYAEADCPAQDVPIVYTHEEKRDGEE